MNIVEWLQTAQTSLRGSGAENARLDALVLMEYISKIPREQLLTHLNKNVSRPLRLRLSRVLKLRLRHYPLAYITGHKEFYGLDFKVNKNVMIPRPETEAIIERALESSLSPSAAVLDMGTGSGCIAAVIKKHRPGWQVAAADISVKALALARQNAKSLGVKLKFIRSNLFSKIDDKFDLVLANLPYVPLTEPVSPEAEREPASALYGGADGLDIYRAFLKEVKSHLKPGAKLIIEAMPQQMPALRNLAKTNGFSRVSKVSEYVLELS